MFITIAALPRPPRALRCSTLQLTSRKDRMHQKTLFLLRHAKAEKDIEVVDWLRPLKKRGVRAAKHMGAWLTEHNLQPELIISSPAKRAFSTAKKVCQAMDRSSSDIRQDERIYNATLELLYQVLQECPDSAQSVLIVGHNPSLEEFLKDVSQDEIEEAPDGKLLPTTALAQLEITIPWAEIRTKSASYQGITRIKEIEGL